MKTTKVFITIESLILIISVVAFFKFICINMASICPAFLMFLSIMQTLTFISASNDSSPYDTAYSVNNTLTNDDYKMLCKMHAMSKITIMPMLALFIFFFSSVWKLIVPIVIYVVSFVIVKLLFTRYKKWWFNVVNVSIAQLSYHSFTKEASFKFERGFFVLWADFYDVYF